MLLSAAGAAVWLAAGPARGANTADTLTKGTALDVAGDWSLGAVPNVSSDAIIGATYPTAATILTFNSSTSTTQTFGSLDDTSPYLITIQNQVSNASGGTPTVTLTLGGGGSTNAYSPTTATSAGDLLYVASGSSLLLNSSTSSTASYGMLSLVLGQSGNFDVGGTAVINSTVAGTASLTKTGGGTLAFNSSSSSTYNGSTFINAGIVQVVTTNDLGESGLAAYPATQINISGGAFRLALTSSLGTSRAFTMGAAGGTILVSAGGTLQLTSGGMNGPGSLTVGDLTGTTSTAGLADTGTLSFATTSVTYAGATTVDRATLNVAVAGTIPATTALTLNSGTFTLTTGQTKNITVASTTLGLGASNISVGAFNVASSTPALSLGPIGRSTGATADLVLPTAGSVNTTTGNTTAGGGTIIGGFLTTSGGTSFATSAATGGAAGTITALATYGTTYGSATSTTDFDTGGASGTLTAVDTLRFSTGTASTVTPGGALVVSAGGILVTPAVGGSQSVIGSGGTLTSGTTELFLHQFDTSSTLLVQANVIDSAAGATSLVKAGPGTAILDASNTYTGTTYVNAGTLQVGNGDTNGTLGTGPIVTNTGGTLSFDRTDANGFVVTTPITGAGNVASIGQGANPTLILDASNTYTGTTTIAAGSVLQVGNNDTGASLGTGTVALAGSLFFAQTNTYTNNDAITGGGAVYMDNVSGTLVGNVTTSFTGGTVVLAGTVQFGTTNYFGTGGFTIFNGAIRDTLGVSSGRVYTLSASNSTVDVSAGQTFTFSAASPLAGSGSLNVNNATTTSTTGVADTGTLAITNLTSSFGGPINVNAGTLLLTSSSNTYAGNLTINGGKAYGYFGTSFGTAAISVGAGTLEVNDSATAANTVSTLANNLTLTNAASTVQVGTSIYPNTVTASGVFSGSGGLTLTGPGSLSLTSNNTYAGNTVITSGALLANNGVGAAGSATGTGTSVTVNSGATLGGTGVITQAVAVSGTITAGQISSTVTTPTTGNLSTGAQSWNSSGSYLAKVSADGTTSDQLTMTGLTIGSLGATPFTVALTGLGGATSPTSLTTAQEAGTVLAIDTNTSQVGVFTNALAGTAPMLVLTTTNVSAADGGTLGLTELDTAGGEELVLDEAATPEPTSLLLAGLAAVPLALGRRRRTNRAGPRAGR
jgi:fibronectin-binding autotransporter adhesin